MDGAGGKKKTALVVTYMTFQLLHTVLHKSAPVLFPHCFRKSDVCGGTLRLSRSIPHRPASLRNTPLTISDLSARQTIPLRLSEARRERSLHWHLDDGLCRRRSLLPVTADGQVCERNISLAFGSAGGIAPKTLWIYCKSPSVRGKAHRKWQHLEHEWKNHLVSQSCSSRPISFVAAGLKLEVSLSLPHDERNSLQK